MNNKRTKIVATIGPSSSDPETLRAMILHGMNVARINFSHIAPEDYENTTALIQLIREIAKQENRVVGILCDIQGPKIRIGQVGEGIELATGDKITLTTDEADGTDNVVSLPHPEFVKDIHTGAQLLLDDGNLEFTVTESSPTKLICEVVIGGLLKSRKGVTATNAKLTLSAITSKDRQDIEFALKQLPEYIAMSFVRSADDIRQFALVNGYVGRRCGNNRQNRKT